MTKRMLIDASHPEETRMVITDRGNIDEFDFVTAAKNQIKGNIYLAKITRVEPSLQAAFVDYGSGKQGFLSFSEIHPDYYQIPVADRKRLLEEQERQNQEEEAQEEAELESPSKKPSRNRRRSKNKSDDGQENNAEGSDVSDDTDEKAASDDKEEKTGGRSRLRRRRRYSNRTKEARVEQDDDASVSSEALPEDLKDDEAPPKKAAKSTRKPTKKAAPKKDTDASTEADTEDAAKTETDDDKSTEKKPARRTRSSRKKTDEKQDTKEKESKNNTATDEDENVPADEPDTIETASDDEDIEQHRTKSNSFSKRYKIQEVIKRGQIVLVQVIKEERGNKGVSLTTYMSLAGRYCVLMPNSSKGGGISRKIARHDERKRLRSIASEMKKLRGMSAIIRTAGVDRTKAEIKRDYEYLIKLWNSIREEALASTAPALVHEESNIMKRSIRDHYNPEIEEVWVEGENAYRTAKNFMKLIMPSHAPRVKQYKDSTPLFSEYNVETQLHELYEPTAKLKSGGYVVIDHTEALISIDVNSGRSTTERNVEETALKTNLEAATEIARQLRLRDLGGLVVIDFIDMYYGKHRRNVERTFRDAMKSDRAKVQVGHISPFGLMELSRQRLRPSIGETTTNACPHCQGSGSIRSQESLSIEIVRHLEQESSTGNFREFRITVSDSMAVFLLNHARHHLTKIEKDYDVTIQILTDANFIAAHYTVEKIRHHHASGQDRSQQKSEERSQQPRRSRGGKKQRERQQRRQQREEQAAEEDQQSSEKNTEENTPPKADSATDNESGEPKKTRSRGGRGRRGSGARKTENTATSEEPQAEAATPQKETAKPSAAKKPTPTSADSAQSESDAKASAPAKEPTVEKPSKPEAAKETPAAPLPEPKAAARKSTRSSAKPAEKEIPASEEKSGPKRKGWWNRVVG